MTSNSSEISVAASQNETADDSTQGIEAGIPQLNLQCRSAMSAQFKGSLNVTTPTNLPSNSGHTGQQGPPMLQNPDFFNAFWTRFGPDGFSPTTKPHLVGGFLKFCEPRFHNTAQEEVSALSGLIDSLIECPDIYAHLDNKFVKFYFDIDWENVKFLAQADGEELRYIGQSGRYILSNKRSGENIYLPNKTVVAEEPVSSDNESNSFKKNSNKSKNVRRNKKGRDKISNVITDTKQNNSPDNFSDKEQNVNNSTESNVFVNNANDNIDNGNDYTPSTHTSNSNTPDGTMDTSDANKCVNCNITITPDNVHTCIVSDADNNISSNNNNNLSDVAKDTVDKNSGNSENLKTGVSENSDVNSGTIDNSNTLANNLLDKNSGKNDISNDDGFQVVGKPKYTIFVELKGNWCLFLGKIQEVLGTKPQVQTSRDLLRIKLFDDDSFRKIQKYLMDNKIKFQTLDPRDQRPAKYCIKGIPVTTPVDVIEDWLRGLGYTPLKIAYLKSTKTRSPLPIYMVTIRPTPNHEDLLKVTEFNLLTVKVEEFKSSPIKQCYNCQAYGHSSLTCSLSPKCLRCAGGHTVKNCPLPRGSANLKCANCGENHSANFRGCKKNPYSKHKNNTKAVMLNGVSSNDNNTQKNSKTQNRPSPRFVPAPLPTTFAWGKSQVPSNANVQKSVTLADLTAPLGIQDSGVDKGTLPQETTSAPVTTTDETAQDANETTVASAPTSNWVSTQVKAKPRNRKGKTKFKKKNKKSNKSKEPESPLTQAFLHILKIIQKFCETFTAQDIVKFFTELAEAFAETSPLNKTFKLVTIITKYVTPLLNYGQ